MSACSGSVGSTGWTPWVCKTPQKSGRPPLATIAAIQVLTRSSSTAAGWTISLRFRSRERVVRVQRHGGQPLCHDRPARPRARSTFLDSHAANKDSRDGQRLHDKVLETLPVLLDLLRPNHRESVSL